jgi:hypothetical protein
MKTDKEVAIFILEKLIEQGGCSITDLGNGDSICMYRGNNGRKCAVGHCIPDEKYRPSLECSPVNSLIHYKVIDEEYLEHGYVLQLLQRLHDRGSLSKTDKEKVLEFKQCLDIVSDTSEEQVVTTLCSFMQKL